MRRGSPTSRSSVAEVEPWVGPDHDPVEGRKARLHERVNRRFRNGFEPSPEATIAKDKAVQAMAVVARCAHDLIDLLPEGRYLSMVLTDLETVETHAREAAFQDVP